jgi:hypothetical protein
MAANINPTDDSSAMEQLVEAAMIEMGWTLPSTESDVAKLQAENVATPVQLPESLKSFDAVFERIQQPRVIRQKSPVVADTSAISGLRALAARDGATITDECREQMKRDGEEAERELEQRRIANEKRQAQ